MQSTQTFTGKPPGAAQLGVLVDALHSRDEAQDFVDAFNDLDRKAMIEVASVYDINIPGPENPAYVAKVREISEAWEAQLRGRLTPESGAKNEK